MAKGRMGREEEPPKTSAKSIRIPEDSQFFWLSIFLLAYTCQFCKTYKCVSTLAFILGIMSPKFGKPANLYPRNVGRGKKPLNPMKCGDSAMPRLKRRPDQLDETNLFVRELNECCI